MYSTPLTRDSIIFSSSTFFRKISRFNWYYCKSKSK